MCVPKNDVPVSSWLTGTSFKKDTLSA